MSVQDLAVADSKNTPDVNDKLALIAGRIQNLSARGNIGTSAVNGVAVLSVLLSPAAVAANTTAEQAFTVPGLVPLSAVSVSKPTAQAGLGIVGARVSANNQIGITFSNNTGAPITPTAAETYLVLAVRLA